MSAKSYRRPTWNDKRTGKTITGTIPVRTAARPSWAIAQGRKRLGMGYDGVEGLLRAIKRGKP